MLFLDMKKTILLVFTFTLIGCVSRPIAVKNNNTKIHSEQNKTIEQKITKLARTGDWLVTRGYHATDNLVSNVTGIPISHVALLNSDVNQVVEAEGSGVHLTKLKDFIDKSYRLLIIRPRWRTNNNAHSAWDNAFKLVGKKYDFLGTIGFNFPDKYYCSELAINVYDKWHTGKEKFPAVIKPGELYLYGAVLYDSLPRDEMQL
jgi:uncharacterized protein YycO